MKNDIIVPPRVVFMAFKLQGIALFVLFEIPSNVGVDIQRLSWLSRARRRTQATWLAWSFADTVSSVQYWETRGFLHIYALDISLLTYMIVCSPLLYSGDASFSEMLTSSKGSPGSAR